MESFDEIVEKQNQLITSMSKATTNFKKLGQARMTHATTMSRIERVKELFREIRLLDAKLRFLSDAKSLLEHPYFKDNLFERCEEIKDATIDYMTEVAAQTSQNASLDTSQASTDHIVTRPISRLPRIDLPKFDGSFERWETFRDRFKSMIINNPNLTNVDRLHYLSASVTGSAGDAISQLTVTDANFQVAWQILSARYENIRRLVNSHLEALLSLPIVVQETAKDLQTLRDTANMSIQALKKLGRPVETWDDILIHLVSQKLDKASRKAWELKLSESQELPSYTELNEFLDNRVRAFEVISPFKQSSATKPTASKSKATKSISSHSTAVKFECVICKGQHPLFKCVQFLSYTPERRFEFIKTSKRCYNCLAANHTLRDCKNEYRCRECQQKHHSLLHTSKSAGLPCDESSSSNETTKTNQNDDAEGRYVVRLPFRTGPPIKLGDSRAIALSNLHRVERQLQRTPATAAEYSAFLEEYQKLGHMEKIGRYQCILWRSSPSAPVEEFRLLTVTYGTAAAPFLALRVLQQLALDEGAPFPLAVPVIQRQTYVDDCIFGADDLESAQQTRNQLISLLSKGGFRLRKWASNCPALLNDLDPSDHGLAGRKELPIAKTKREILSIISKFFDPLGWVAPVTVTAKIFLQRLWSIKCSWDADIPAEIFKEWEKFQTKLPLLEQISIPRWTHYHPSCNKIELHGFSDASTKAYAASLYLRVISSDGSITNTLLMAKSKVAPLKILSVPRLELCAALLLAQLMTFVRSIFLVNKIDYWCWTDSMIVLAWLKQPPSRWKTFVANRVSKIQRLLPEGKWNHVPTHDNPADCASRGMDPDNLRDHTLWWTGPPWLQANDDKWSELPNFETPVLPKDVDTERRASITLCATCASSSWDLQSRFSSWTKLLRVTAYIFRYIQNLKTKREKTNNPHIATKRNLYALHPHEIQIAKILWIKQIQTQLFNKELASLYKNQVVPKSSSLASLSPYLDSNGLIRVQGWLGKSRLPEDTKHPIILKSHPLVNTLITHTHVHALHAGPQLTLAILRQNYWLLRARATVRSVLYRCITCTRQNARVPEQFMGELPDFRVNPNSRAFVHTGVDYAGESFSVLELAEQRLSRWQLVQQISERVWKAWKDTYLHTLQQRPKWRSVQNLATQGRMVLIRDPLAPPSHWKLGRIAQCHPGSDNLTRVVTVKTADSEYKRPITKICFLPVDINLDQEQSAMICYMSQIIGPKDNTKEATYKILKKVISNTLASEFTLKGATNLSKKCFEKLTLYEVVQGAIVNKRPDTEIQEIATATSLWLKQAPWCLQDDGSMGKRKK
ncbi:PREDICTED: uncharacterized protein LOC105556738 [Vollenhovia emeryi]|uniref:uncharacterized protein LOC105556738 n=1 Tax=Vollenhovia emeryi TaxID=411798 RepID=UPI0005F39C09|nr:PREDICTED: uncharacterized protein LOC105556738 [Vollenhovia emeryi]